ncbi:signal peptidase I [Streptomyces sp. NPDC092296]|uniref:signal peptidase I n=1 Tax=Streptomyces sp. NPDC092296 TaxID=3366012 RepID=UPI0037FE316E
MGSRGRERVPEPAADDPPGPGETDRDDAGRGEKRRRTAGMGRAERRRIARRAARRRKRSYLRELPLVGGVALVVALLLKTFLLQVFVIPSASMENTLRVGDRVVVDKLTPWFGKDYRRGDVVVFKDPGHWLDTDHEKSADGPVTRGVKRVFAFIGLLPSDDEGDLIKRVIGVGGDTVACCDDDGRVTVNGTPVDEPYLAPGNLPSQIPFTVTVPPGRLWVMGDHRDVSADSRVHMANPGGGTIPVGNVIGRAMLVVWPFTHVHRLPEPPSLSALPDAADVPPSSQNLGQSAPRPVVQPGPEEPSLVIGVAGAMPLAVRRWRRGVPPRR